MKESEVRDEKNEQNGIVESSTPKHENVENKTQADPPEIMPSSAGFLVGLVLLMLVALCVIGMMLASGSKKSVSTPGSDDEAVQSLLDTDIATKLSQEITVKVFSVSETNINIQQEEIDDALTIEPGKAYKFEFDCQQFCQNHKADGSVARKVSLSDKLGPDQEGFVLLQVLDADESMAYSVTVPLVASRNVKLTVGMPSGYSKTADFDLRNEPLVFYIYIQEINRDDLA